MGDCSVLCYVGAITVIDVALISTSVFLDCVKWGVRLIQTWCDYGVCCGCLRLCLWVFDLLWAGVMYCFVVLVAGCLILVGHADVVLGLIAVFPSCSSDSSDSWLWPL